MKEILLRFENFRKFLTAPFVQSIAERILIRTQEWCVSQDVCHLLGYINSQEKLTLRFLPEAELFLQKFALICQY